MSSYLKVDQHLILDSKDKPVFLRGVNLGGWLMKEAYILYAPNRAEQLFRREFIKELGEEAWEEFEKAYQDHFIQPKDFEKIASYGFNCIRLPIHYRVLEGAPYQFRKEGFQLLDQIFEWVRENNLYLILDLHAAPGCQNHDWHSDSEGKAEFWKEQDYQDRAVAIWKEVAKRYRDETSLAGYDLLNEAVTDDTTSLNRFYRQAIQAIREMDSNHIIFVEGNKWATDLSCLDEFDDKNYALSIHTYEPLNFTFNFVPGIAYPYQGSKGTSNSQTVQKHLSRYKEEAVRRKIPILVGEFGVNYRDGLYGEQRWLQHHLQCFQEYGFHWTYWTYKAIKNSTFPDGILSYYDNPPWVNRVGPVKGWETFSLHWKKEKEAMMRSWETDQFKENAEILKVLTTYARKNYQPN